MALNLPIATFPLLFLSPLRSEQHLPHIFVLYLADTRDCAQGKSLLCRFLLSNTAALPGILVWCIPHTLLLL